MVKRTKRGVTWTASGKADILPQLSICTILRTKIIPCHYIAYNFGEVEETNRCR